MGKSVCALMYRMRDTITSKIGPLHQQEDGRHSKQALDHSKFMIEQVGVLVYWVQCMAVIVQMETEQQQFFGWMAVGTSL